MTSRSAGLARRIARLEHRRGAAAAQGSYDFSLLSDAEFDTLTRELLALFRPDLPEVGAMTKEEVNRALSDRATAERWGVLDESCEPPTGLIHLLERCLR